MPSKMMSHRLARALRHLLARYPQLAVVRADRASGVKSETIGVPPVRRDCSCCQEHASWAGCASAIILKGCAVLPAYGVALDRLGRIIADTTASEYRLNRLIQSGRVAFRLRAQRVRGLVTAIEQGFMWDNHYHWLVDALPRVNWLWAEATRKAVGRTVTVYVRRFAASTLRDLLRALLPPYVAVAECELNAVIRPDAYLHLPALSRDYCGWLPADYIDRFRRACAELFNCGPTEPKQRLYVSRSFAPKRRIINEDEVAAWLSSRGVQRIHAECLPFAEQARLFASASLIIGPHGAGLTNMLFAKPCRVVELLPGPPLGHYRELARCLGHDYTSARFGASHKNQDFVVPVAALAALL